MHTPTMDETDRTAPGFQDRRMPRLRASRGSEARAVREKTGPLGHEIQVLSLRLTAGPRSIPTVLGFPESARDEGEWMASET